ncbi:sigma-E processing peptidase SpoIIGA [Paenibacillus selenitireducens]|uniref:Sporulation sigma-E factor-processing peptidase n=1 Tax=Paenibacillus selenitireducens TaxID=1324314 RepID=A0A1T2XFV7_9BACL|nr:sigma-E processing peptidase SpoIIGA [Paenibacillus selenitireducens]
MVVYIDLIFLMNLLIDAALLWTTAWMRKLKPRIWRLIVAAVLGACYVVMMFAPALSFMFTFLIKFAISFVMLWIAFGFISLQNYLRNMAAFYVINFVAAGGILGAHYLLQNSGDVLNGIWFSHSGGFRFDLKVGFWLVVLGFIVTVLLYKTVIRSRANKETMTQFLAQVHVWIDQEQSSCIGLIDTGNQLTDPLTRTPVIVMEASLWQHVLPEGWAQRLRTMETDQLIMEMQESSIPWQDRLRMVPFRGVNRGATQWMLAIKPDKVAITHEGTTTECTKVLIGLDGGTLSSDGSYRAILHPTLLQH